MSEATTKPSPPEVEELRHLHSLNEAIEYFVGSLGWRQFLQSLILSMAWFFDSQQAFITVFTDSQPKWHCINNNTTSSTYYNKRLTQVLCSTNTDNVCKLPVHSWSWESPARTSIVSEWSLQCASPIVRGLPASSFLAGCLIGGFLLGTLGDSLLGRKNLLVICCMIMSLSGIVTAFSANIWMYSTLRLISGFGRAAIGSCALVLTNEIIGKKWRDKISIIGYLCFTLGFLSLPIIAFSLQGRSWRLMYLVTSIPCTIYALIVYFSVYESPRWLFVRGKREEFAKSLKRFTGNNKGVNFMEDFDTWTAEISPENGIWCALKLLLNKRWAVRRLVATLVVYFGVGMAYFGMPLGLGSLSFNLYMSSIFNALAEIPATIAAFFSIGKLNRKVSIFWFCLVSGVCGLGSVVVPEKSFQMVLEVISFFGVCTACDVLLIYTLELFPTCVRNSILTVARQAAVFGGMLSPVLIAAGRGHRWVSYGVFGVVILLSGIVVVWLPETRGKALADTVDEEERKWGDEGRKCSSVVC